MSLLDAISSLDQAILKPGASSFFPLTSPASSALPRRTSVAGRLVNAVRWFQKLCARTLLPPKSRRLRVSETVALGDKRFVSIVEVDGVDYLIGGGTANVSLLTRLGQTAAESSFQQTVAEAWEQTKTA